VLLTGPVAGVTYRAIAWTVGRPEALYASAERLLASRSFQRTIGIGAALDAAAARDVAEALASARASLVVRARDAEPARAVADGSVAHTGSSAFAALLHASSRRALANGSRFAVRVDAAFDAPVQSTVATLEVPARALRVDETRCAGPGDDIAMQARDDTVEIPLAGETAGGVGRRAVGPSAHESEVAAASDKDREHRASGQAPGDRHGLARIARASSRAKPFG
jgi:hypothetical protein